MEIRSATPKDSLTLSALCRDVQSLHAEHHPKLFKMAQSDDFAVEFFDEMLATPDVTAYIAEDGGRPLGYILCRLVDRPENAFTYPIRYLLVDQISVRPDAQRKGVGTALLKQAEDFARELGLAKLQLDSWDFNLEAHACFEKFGFEKFNYRFWKTF
jgi:ribosomal protein S18 acetylase RimI-like enzyme